MTVKALLFDLDDTLLINDIEQFTRPYFQALLAKVAHICPAKPFMEALNTATVAMWRNDGSRGTNAEVFAAEFFPRIGRQPEDVLPILEEFYAQDFETLRPYTAVDPQAETLVRLALERGYQVAVATQPIFPLAAIRARLRWAGVGDDRFAYDYIACYERMSACKPHPFYFQTIVQHLQRQPDECMMIGNSLEEDMPARRLGLKTFWVDRGRVSRPATPVYDAEGSLADLIQLVTTGGIHEL